MESVHDDQVVGKRRIMWNVNPPRYFHRPLLLLGLKTHSGFVLFPPNIWRFTFLLLTTHGTAQYELHQLAQFSDISHLADEVDFRQVLVGHLVTQHLRQEKSPLKELGPQRMLIYKKNPKTPKKTNVLTSW